MKTIKFRKIGKNFSKFQENKIIQEAKECGLKEDLKIME